MGSIIFKLTAIFLLILSFKGCSVVKEINAPINENEISAKQLVTIGDSLMNQYYEGKGYQIGRIDMNVDRELRGQITLTYTDRNDDYRPNIVYIEIDTNLKIVLSIRDGGNNSKLNPGIINFNGWKIDSTEAINITKDLYRVNKQFQYDSITIFSNNQFQSKYETWFVDLNDSINKIVYYSQINAFDGTVLDYGSKTY